jgi:hypothetical protein
MFLLVREVQIVIGGWDCAPVHFFTNNVISPGYIGRHIIILCYLFGNQSLKNCLSCEAMKFSLHDLLEY